MSDDLAPRARLRTRVTAFFLLAALPAVVLAVAAVVYLDRLIGQEIRDRIRETAAEADRMLDDERARVDRAVAALARDDEIRLLAAQVDAADLGAFEGLAGRLAPAHGLDLLALVPARGPHSGALVSSAHLPAAVGDDAPGFVAPMMSVVSATAALAYDWAEGNPPALVPALIGGAVVTRAGRPALIVYGGARLDGHRLTHVARAGQATFVLRASGAEPAIFPPGAKAPRRGRRTRVLRLPTLAGGAPEAEATAGGGRLELHVDTARLDRARTVVVTAALALGGASLLAALLAGAFLSRRLTGPLVELSDAARRVGAGQLDVQISARSKDEVGTLVRVFNRMTTELSDSRERLARAERVAAWQQIARRVAHEIKNPLFPIQMSMETLRKSFRRQHPKLDEIMEESTQTVLEEVRALNRIVTEFSDFARLPTPDRRAVPAQALLQHVLSLYQSTASDEGGPRVRLEPAEAVPDLWLDKGQVSRALINLVKNALEAMDGTGQVTLRALAGRVGDRDGAWLEVEDDGPGMPPEVQREVFTPYFTTKEQGTGLGLAIVDRIASEHDGEVRIDSEPGRGTRVRLWIPVAEADSAEG